MSVSPAHFLVTGLYGLRDVVLALPRLQALRTTHPDTPITVIAPASARDVLQRLRIANHVQLADGRPALALQLWGWWRRLIGHFSCILTVSMLPDAMAVDWSSMARDFSFLELPKPLVLLSLPDGWPAVRAAAFAHKLAMMGYHLGVIGLTDSAAQSRLCKAAPQARDLAGRFDLADIPAVARHAVCVIGGRDGITAISALSGTRTLVITEGEDRATDILPVDNTVWLQCDDVSFVSVGDVIKAAQL